MKAIEEVQIPSFGEFVVADHLRDGYWLEAANITGTRGPDLIGSGLKVGEIYWYQNPGWEKHLLADHVKEPVGMAVADITGTGNDDVAICYQLYGPGGTIHHADPEGGKIDWFENPGNGDAQHQRWRRRYVGRAPGMHRLRAGHFTRTDRIQILGCPIVGVGKVHAVLPVVLFTAPDDLDSLEWDMEVISDNQFRMIHGVAQRKSLYHEGLDCVLIASDEGVTLGSWDQDRWVWEHIGSGEESQFDHTTFKGSGDVDGGSIGNEALAYVAAVEPFHGNTIAVYTKTPDQGWQRFVLDTFGEPNENGEGPGHSVMCADFDGDGDDEFLIGLRGPWPWQGAVYYKALDIARGLFLKWRVSDESVARIVAADFDQTGSLDYATIAYSVEHYFVADHPVITLHPNRIGALPNV